MYVVRVVEAKQYHEGDDAIIGPFGPITPEHGQWVVFDGTGVAVMDDRDFRMQYLEVDFDRYLELFVAPRVESDDDSLANSVPDTNTPFARSQE